MLSLLHGNVVALLRHPHASPGLLLDLMNQVLFLSSFGYDDSKYELGDDIVLGVGLPLTVCDYTALETWIMVLLRKCLVDPYYDISFCHVVQWLSMPTHLQMPHRSKSFFLSSIPLSSGSLKD